MLLQNNQLEVKNIGFENTSQMSIKNENLSKIFRLLTTSVYKDSKSSVLRELLSNSIDSQVVIGKINDPVYLKYNNGVISIIDNGAGMSDEFIKTRYMSLGDSTKEEDENLIGAFGLGCKSVFAYTTHYTLISRYNGIKTKYLISVSDTGLPDVITLEENNTEECNGVEIQFELLKDSDYYDFQEAAENQLKYFRNIIIEGFEISNDYKIIKGNDFLYRPDRTNVNNILNLVWENIVYPIDFNFLGIQPIKVNCALYFPQKTPFQPEAARENLRNTESNKKLILDKIEEFREELTSLWKNQQIIDSFFEWNNKYYKTIKFDEHELDVSSIITEEYIWKPLLNTHMSARLVKQNTYNCFDKLFSYRKNSRFINNSWSRIGENNKIFHAEKDVTSNRLSRIGWNAICLKRELIYPLNNRDVRYWYDKDQIEIDKNYEIVPPKFDYIAELEYIRDEIWSEITEKSVDAHSVTLARQESVRRKYSNDDVRAKFSDDWYTDNQWKVKKLGEIRKFKYVVYTQDESIYKNLKYFKPTFVNKRSGKQLEKGLLFILTNSKYVSRLGEFMSYEQFLDSEFLKKLYLNSYEYKNPISNSQLDNWINMHPMYEAKFKNFTSNIRNNYSIPNLLVGKLSEKYSTEYIDKQNERLRNNINKYKVLASKDVLKYQMLYKFQKSKLTKLQEKCD